MILENLGITDIAPQGIDWAVAAHVHHLENRGTALGSGRKKASPQWVAGELRRIEANALGMGLNDIGYALIGEPRADLAALTDRAK
jgi:hypothetical protein